MDKIKAGTWVEIEKILLSSEQRAPQIPEDTRKTPYVMKVAGFLSTDAILGDEVVIKTLCGRLISGKLKVVRPHYEHSFGETVEELLTIGLGGEL
ncbi:MAG: 2-amino-4-ketopentanoate thiolase [Erysipelotrichia bacterium]|nr:2-amino-4-ketopentanoate thiolase [Erysipelotrichia bacterium]